MRRRTFDALVSTGGMIVAAVLLVAGALLMWGHSFINTNVHNQPRWRRCSGVRLCGDYC